MATKICSVCKREKDAGEFYVKDKKTGRLFSWCKDCHAAKGAADYEAKKEIKLARMKAKREEKIAADPDFHAREAERQRKWREEHPEESKAANRRHDAKRRDKRKAYRALNREQIKARNAEYREANKDKIDAYNAAYREANKELLRERSRQWREENRERDYEIHSRWKRANKAMVNAQTHKRRALINGCTEHYTVAEWEALKAAQDYTCLMCGRREPEIKLTVDHVVPVSKGGGNAITNLQGLCGECNNRKHSRTLDLR